MNRNRDNQPAIALHDTVADDTYYMVKSATYDDPEHNSDVCMGHNEVLGLWPQLNWLLSDRDFVYLEFTVDLFNVQIRRI